MPIKKLISINIRGSVRAQAIPESQKEHVMPIAGDGETRKQAPDTPPALVGRWQVDAQASQAHFLASTLAGLVKTPGWFHSMSGELLVEETHAAGVLAIESSSIDTGNRMRDRHLRSRAFFDAKRHPELRYEARSISSRGPGGARIEGELVVADTRTPLALEVMLRAPTGDVVELACRTEVDRVALGLRGARGMVPRAVQLDVAITLRRAFR
jgi:polyisoprenoid-binding protein YceI